MKIIFLDVDGVLNSSPKARGDRPTGGLLGIDHEPLEQLARIVQRTGAFIVVTSTWKRVFGNPWQAGTMQFLTDRLHRYNIEITGTTSECDPSNRGAGIRRWLLYHADQVESWAVLDDDVFPDYAENDILPHLVKTNFYNGGLTKDLADRCICVLEMPFLSEHGCGCCPLDNGAALPETQEKPAISCAESNCPRQKRTS